MKLLNIIVAVVGLSAIVLAYTTGILLFYFVAIGSFAAGLVLSRRGRKVESIGPETRSNSKTDDAQKKDKSNTK